MDDPSGRQPGLVRVTDRSPGAVTDPKSLTLPYRQRSRKPVTIGHRGLWVTDALIGVVARAHVWAHKAATRNTGHIGHPAIRAGRP